MASLLFGMFIPEGTSRLDKDLEIRRQKDINGSIGLRQLHDYLKFHITVRV